MKRNRTTVAGFAVALIATSAITSANAGNTRQSGAPTSANTPVASAHASRAATTTKVVSINDPVFGMTAYSLNIPDSWIFQGSVIQGTSCVTAATPVFRISAPDGLTGVKWFPRMDWAWSDEPNVPAKSESSSCLPYKKIISASDFLKYMIGILKVEYMKDLPTPNLAALQRNAAANSTPLIITTADAANFQVRYHINQIEIEEHLNGVVMCSTDKTSPKTTVHTCSASLGRSWARQGSWSGDTFAFTQHSLTVDEKWSAAVYFYSHRTADDLRKERPPNLDEEGQRRNRAQLDATLQSVALHKNSIRNFSIRCIPARTRLCNKVARPPFPPTACRTTGATIPWTRKKSRISWLVNQLKTLPSSSARG